MSWQFHQETDLIRTDAVTRASCTVEDASLASPVSAWEYISKATTSINSEHAQKVRLIMILFASK